MSRTRNQGSNWIRKDKRLAIYLRDGCRCVYCHRDAAMGAVMTLDHIVACERGGSNEPTNLITCCRRCNSSKSDLTPRQWAKVLNDRGFDSAAIARSIRRQKARSLATYRRQALTILESIEGNLENLGQVAQTATA